MEVKRSVDDYLKGLPADQRAGLEKLMKATRTAAPGAVEGFYYKLPAFKLGDRWLVAFDAFESHLSLFRSSKDFRQCRPLSVP